MYALKSIQEWIGKEVSIIRAMPNTPALINCGATALYANHAVNSAQRLAAENIFNAVGKTVWVNTEELIDVVTALSVQGLPIFFFLWKPFKTQQKNWVAKR